MKSLDDGLGITFHLNTGTHDTANQNIPTPIMKPTPKSKKIQ